MGRIRSDEVVLLPISFGTFEETLMLMETLELLSDYELEPHRRTGGKPMPTLIHGAIQLNLGFELKLHYGSTYRVASEVLLATQPDGSTPDLVLYPAGQLDYAHDPARRTDAPLLVVEIQSASQGFRTSTQNVRSYFQFGVRSCWIVAPDLRAVFVYSDPLTYIFFHQSDTLRDPALGIELNLQPVFG